MTPGSKNDRLLRTVAQVTVEGPTDARRTTPVLVRGSRRWPALHPDARTLGGDEAAPTTLITGLDSADPEESCFRDEAFAPVLTVTSINATNIDE